MQQQELKRDFLATRRSKLITEEDLDLFLEKIEIHISNKKILVIGGAGSIGSSFIDEISEIVPSFSHVETGINLDSRM